MSPGPRRRRITGQDWIKQSSQDQVCRPGSSLGQVLVGDSSQNVKAAVSGWSDLSKSKSSAAVLLQEREKRPRTRSRERKDSGSFLLQQQQQKDQQQQQHSVLSEAHTNQVHETVTKWGQNNNINVDQPAPERATPVPITRHIGDTFADSKNTVIKPKQESMTNNSQASTSTAPWRTKTPSEPSVKVVNVAVENNVHISENAASQMASFVQQETSTKTHIEQKQSMTQSSMMTSSSSSSSKSIQQQQSSSEMKHVSSQVPPKSPNPTRKMPSGTPKGKSAHNTRPATVAATEVTAASSSSPPILEQSKPIFSNSSGQIPMCVTTNSSSTMCSSTSSSWCMKEEYRSEQQQQQKSESKETSDSSILNTKHPNDYSVLNEWLAGEEKQLEESIKNLEKNNNATFKHLENTMIEHPIEMPDINLKGKVKDNVAIFQAEKSSAIKVENAGNQTTLVGENLEGSHGKAKQALMQHTDKDITERVEHERIQRAKELDEIKQAAKVHHVQRQSKKSECNDDLDKPSVEVLEARSRMLQEVASRREDTPTSEDDFVTSQEKAAERAKQERNKELAEIAEMRNRTNWQDVVATDVQSRNTPTRTPDLDLEEARTTIRNAAARWQERELKQPRFGTPPSGRNTPSRRIGNLFNRGADHWSMEADNDEEFPDPPKEEFPDPPTEIEMQVSLPAPPPRDSSKDVMMEYGSNGNNTGNGSNCKRAKKN